MGGWVEQWAVGSESLTQQFPFSGSFSGPGGASLRVSPGLAQQSLFPTPRKHPLQPGLPPPLYPLQAGEGDLGRWVSSLIYAMIDGSVPSTMAGPLCTCSRMCIGL